MDKKEILYFEEDDASTVGNDGKQIFVAKRINGKVTHNKMEDVDGERKNILSKEDKKENESNKEIYIPQVKKVQVNGSKKDENKKTNIKEKKKKEKRERKRKKRLKVIKFLILLMIVGAMIVFALVSPIFNIKEIVISGNKQIDSETIVSLSKIKKETNIFKIKSSEISKNIKENAYIEKVNVKRNFPDTVEINVEERIIAYQIQVIDSYVCIDYKGYILTKSSDKQNVPIVEGLATSQEELLKGKKLVKDDTEALNSILKIVENGKKIEIYEKISKIIIDNNCYILYFQNENKYAYLGNGSDITSKMSWVKEILDKEKGKSGKIFVNGDLNDGFKPYFREEKI